MGLLVRRWSSLYVGILNNLLNFCLVSWPSEVSCKNQKTGIKPGPVDDLENAVSNFARFGP